MIGAVGWGDTLAGHIKWSSRLAGVMAVLTFASAIIAYYNTSSIANFCAIIVGFGVYFVLRWGFKLSTGISAIGGLLGCIIAAPILTSKWVMITLVVVIGVLIYALVRSYLRQEIEAIEQHDARLQNEVLACREVMDALALTQSRAEAVVAATKEHIARLRSQIPRRMTATDMLSYVGSSVLAHASIARRECLTEAVGNEGEPRILREWAVLKEPSTSGFNQLDSQHLRCFWQGPSGQIIPAVQHLTYIFLTDRSLYVYTTFYDFIQDKSFGNEVGVFYYKSVTNIGVRQRDLSNPLFPKGLPVQEFTVTNAGGGRLTVALVEDDIVSAKLLPSLWENSVADPADASATYLELGDSVQDIDVPMAEAEDVYTSEDIIDEVFRNFGLSEQGNGVDQVRRYIQKAIDEYNTRVG